MKQMVIGIVIGMLVALIGMTLEAQVNSWQFEADRVVEVYDERSLDSALVRTLAPGEIVTVYGPYVQAEDLIWIRLLGTDDFAAVARYGVCEIRSFGIWSPANRAPLSVYATE